MAKLSGIEVRLGPEDEYMHPGPEPTFNESMYFNTYDPVSDVGVFLRVGNRPNEGYAEVTTCIYLPDGRVAFMFGRPEIDGNERFDAGGIRFEVVAPFDELRIGYEGKVVVLEHPLDMADPRAAFTANPWEDCTVELTVRGAAEPWGGEPEIKIEREGRSSPRATTSSSPPPPAPCGSPTSSCPSTAGACATTPGARAPGKPRGTTAGSRSTCATARA